MLGGILPSSGQITKKALMLALAVPEGFIMLLVAVVLDLCGLLVFILSLFGVGVPISFLLDAAGSSSIGVWATTRPFMRSAIGKIGEKAGGVLGGKGSSAGGSVAGGMAKKGVGLGLSVIRFIVTFLIEVIPFLGDIFPGWTFFVIITLVEGEVTS